MWDQTKNCMGRRAFRKSNKSTQPGLKHHGTHYVEVLFLDPWQSLSLSFSFSISPSIYLTIDLSIYLCICLSIHLCICRIDNDVIFAFDTIQNEEILRDFLQKWEVECRADGFVPMRSAIFPLHLSKVLRLPR
jgi:hypothetical protein